MINMKGPDNFSRLSVVLNKTFFKDESVFLQFLLHFHYISLTSILKKNEQMYRSQPPINIILLSYIEFKKHNKNSACEMRQLKRYFFLTFFHFFLFFFHTPIIYTISSIYHLPSNIVSQVFLLNFLLVFRYILNSIDPN